MDFPEDPNRRRIVDNYVIGSRIGSGSFSIVWRARHRHLNTEFAIKEIEKKNLNDKLLKEISISRNINHPNIIRLFEAIQTEDRIYLVLEYCDGGDLGAYINRHGRVTEDVARHFMKQLAAGLQVLWERRLIHRDLKPQNLLLTSNDLTPSLKIGDFGFARYLTQQGLADTLCGSPLYMAPEIIQNQKYDAKADLWSVGVILFQLVIGRPPYHGSSQFELFQNILASSELRFPDGALTILHPDFVDLCRRLLRRNPSDQLRRPVADEPSTSNQSRGADVVDSIERGYVLVRSHFASTESLTSSLERTHLLDSSTSGATTSAKKTDQHVPFGMEIPVSSTSGISDASSCVLDPLTALGSAHILAEAQSLSILHPSTRLQLLDHYVRSLSDLAHEKFKAGLFLESFSVELVVLAIWKGAIRICNSWLASTGEKCAPADPSTKGAAAPDFCKPSSSSSWAERGFIVACERAEKLQKYLQDSHGTEMPDAMETIYQAALHAGRTGGADEYVENWDSAAELYSKAMLLLSFIINEAPSLALNPPFVLAPDSKVQIRKYLTKLQPHWSRCKRQPPTPRPSSVSAPK